MFRIQVLALLGVLSGCDLEKGVPCYDSAASYREGLIECSACYEKGSQVDCASWLTAEDTGGDMPDPDTYVVDTDTDTDTGGEEPCEEATWYIDYDGDGYGSSAYTSMACDQPSGYVADNTDCDDREVTVNPDATEYCDAVDNDCDGVVDEDDAADATLFYEDLDLDGYGTSESWTMSCATPEGYAGNGDDCDDGDAAVHPAAEETCDGLDDDCDGSVPEEELDLDLDGVAECEGDCNDGASGVYPGATETCDGEDDDCDGVVDEDDASDVATWYLDRDDDGYGDSAAADVDCAAPAGYVAVSGDCDDTEATAFPGGTEVCDDLDNDCDGSADNGATDAATWYEDADVDGYGNADSAAVACDEPSGYVADLTDCDDGNAAVYPGADEDDCTDPQDYNCDGSVQYTDADADGFPACEDCDDAAAATNPDADEYCDGIDNDCDDRVDTTDAVDAPTWYADADEDGFGSEPDTSIACDAPSGYVEDSTDCDDDRADVNPDAQEMCDDADADEDCDGTTDDEDSSATGETTWYYDDDGDGYGGTTSVAQCEEPDGDYVEDGEDCDDASRFDYPGATEYADGRDNDCDGEVDESAAPDTGDTGS